MRPRRPVVTGIAAALAAALTGCAEVDSFQPHQVIPPDYRTTFVQVRSCRSSVEHDLVHILVRTSPEVAPVYETGPLPFAPGTVIVKEEYSDSRCSQLTAYTVMKKEKPGTDPAGGDWRWYKVDNLDRILLQGAGTKRCSSCHANNCGGSHPARDFTCALP
jgi:hypothetical protein